MARVLMLTQVLPYPLDAGPKTRAYYMLRHLATRHAVTLVSFVRPSDTPQAVEHLRGICEDVHAVPLRRSAWRNVRAGLVGLISGQPIVIARDENAEMRRLLRRLTETVLFDVIHADQLSMAGWGQSAARRGDSRTVFDAHNAIHILTRRMAEEEPSRLRRLIMQREAGAFARYEADMCRAYDAVLTVIPQDAEHLLDLIPPAERPTLARKFHTLPICVDPQESAPVTRQPGPPTVLHLGTMFWPPNVNGVLWFARQVWPQVRQRVPAARFLIVGKDPPPAVQALAGSAGIEVTGYVADPLPCLAATDAFIVPLHAGSGMRVKIVDAWMRGLPIVSTSLGAEGIDYRDGENILIADQAESFANATVRLLGDAELNARLREHGRAWVETHYAWQTVYKAVDDIYAGLLART